MAADQVSPERAGKSRQDSPIKGSSILHTQATRALTHGPSTSKAIRPVLRSTVSLDSVEIGVAQPMIPPANFGVVANGAIYRSDFPNTANIPFLESLMLRTILTLVDGPSPDDYLDFIQRNKITHRNIVLPANKETIKMSQIDIFQALCVVLDESSYPLLIHCNKGKHRTGCVVACYRKIRGSTVDKATAEYRRYAGAKARPLDEQFIAGFDVESTDWAGRVHELLRSVEPRTGSPAVRSVSVPGRIRTSAAAAS